MRNPEYSDPTKDASFNDLHSCCWQCSPSGVRWCLRNGYDPNQKDNKGWTPLIWLVRMHDSYTRERKRVFRALIKAGADIEYRAPSGDGILELAEGACSPSFYRFLRNEYERLTRRSSRRKKRAAEL